MPEPYVEIARFTTASTLMTALENALDTIDDDTDLIVADRNAALVAKNSAQNAAGLIKIDFMLGGG